MMMCHFRSEMSELKPCPFCGEHQLPDSEDDGNVPYESGMSKVCDFCSATVTHNWNTRPIEDELNKRIAELEAESERFTVHSRIKRQDDKWIPEVQE